MWRLFLTLHRSRPLLAGPGGLLPQALPLREIAAGLALFGLDDAETREETLYLIQQLDEEALAPVGKAWRGDARREEASGRAEDHWQGAEGR